MTTLAIATDLHYLAPDLRDRGEAFELLMQFSDGRRTEYSDEIFHAFLREMLLLRPDVLLITGDLTFNGERLSHERLSAGLSLLRTAGIPVVVLPGNHDLDNRMAGSYIGGEAEPVESVTREEFSAYYPLGTGASAHLIAADPFSLGCVYALQEDLWLMCVDINGNEAPCSLTDEMIFRIRSVLERARERNVRVIGASHQNLMAHNSLLSAGFVMDGGEKLFALYQEYGVRLHLSGHMHVQHWREVSGVTEIVTSALTLPPCQYGVLTIDGNLASYQTRPVDVETWAEKSGNNDPHLLHFANYASGMYLSSEKRKLRMEFADSGLCESGIEELVSGMARVNQAFFAGRLYSLRESSHIRARWQELAPGSFWNPYMDSIFEEKCKDENKVTIRL